MYWSTGKKNVWYSSDTLFFLYCDKFNFETKQNKKTEFLRKWEYKKKKDDFFSHILHLSVYKKKLCVWRIPNLFFLVFQYIYVNSKKKTSTIGSLVMDVGVCKKKRWTKMAENFGLSIISNLSSLYVGRSKFL